MSREASKDLTDALAVLMAPNGSFSPNYMHCSVLKQTEAKALLRERDELRNVLERYTFTYPAFRMKPVGAPGSPARVESERLMELEETAQKVLRGELV